MFDTSMRGGGASVEDHLAKFDMILAYKRITEEHGPSQQLIDFINYDQSLSTELGLESFDNLNIQMQHALLLANFNEDVEFQLAVEGFLGNLKTSIVGVKKEQAELREIDFRDYQNKKVVYNDKELNVVHYSVFDLIRTILKEYQKPVRHMLQLITSTSNKQAWYTFADHHGKDLAAIKNVLVEIDDMWDEFQNKNRAKAALSGFDGTVKFDKSGWDGSKFEDGIKDYFEAHAIVTETVSGMEKAWEKMSHLLSTLEKDPGEESKRAVQNLHYVYNLSKAATGNVYHYFKMMRRELALVAHLFDPE